MKYFKKRFLKTFLSLALAMCVLAWSNLPVLAASGIMKQSTQYPYRYKITNKYSGHPLNIWTTNVNNAYNGCPVTTYWQYVNDNTQWFKFDHYNDYDHWRKVFLMTSTNTRYAVNIGYRGAGSNTILYDQNWDKEFWIIEDYVAYGSGQKHYYRFILNSDPNLCLAENPNTYEVYLSVVGTNPEYEFWYIDAVDQTSVIPHSNLIY